MVAAEVEEIADHTARATHEISSQIGPVRNITGQAVSAIGDIAVRIRAIDGLAGSIAAAVEGQGAAANQVLASASEPSRPSERRDGQVRHFLETERAA
ncbi:hypothetical protein BY998_1215 [Methylobacterium sp. B4]|nr:hypothetical protein BY998_1215 [Methylobacterium sp. B4]